jgi:uncharacterized membrane protein
VSASLQLGLVLAVLLVLLGVGLRAIELVVKSLRPDYPAAGHEYDLEDLADDRAIAAGDEYSPDDRNAARDRIRSAGYATSIDRSGGADTTAAAMIAATTFDAGSSSCGFDGGASGIC